jgi:hypothetical protein
MKSSLFSRRDLQTSSYDMPQALQPLTPPLSGHGCSEGQPYSPTVLQTTSQQLETFLETLQPSQWLSPAAITWNDWDMIVDGYPNPTSTGFIST